MSTPDVQLLQVEAVEDLPVIWNILQRLDRVATLDRICPTPARWQAAITPSELLAVWLLHLLSRGDHRLNQLQPWGTEYHGTLTALLGKPIQPLDAQDDRLADGSVQFVNYNIDMLIFNPVGSHYYRATD